MIGVGVSVTQLAAQGRRAIILGAGPVLAALAVGDNINTKVTWGSYTATAPAVSINAPTLKEYRVNGAASWTIFGSYVVAEGDVIEIRETVTDNTGRQVEFTAARQVPIAIPVNTVLPPVTGIAREGQMLTRGLGSWTGFGTLVYATQWQAFNGSIWEAIDGATGATFVPTAAEVGKTIRARVTATNGGGPAAAFSLATGTVVSASAPQPFSLTVDGDFLIINRRYLAVDGDLLRF